MGDRFDYIIVGGGSAGCVLANRLSARSRSSVCLIEAGADTPPNHTDDVLWDSYPIIAYFDQRHQWPNLRVQTRPDGTMRTYEQARVMGGGSSINGQMANRGQPLDYDEWGEEGASGWSWNAVAPYFRKLERDLDIVNDQHGSDGPVPIRRVGKNGWPAFSLAAAQAVQDSGLPWIDDQNTSEFKPACFPITINNASDRRASSATSYLTNDVRSRANLTILAKTRVRRLLFDGSRCIGVEVETGSVPRSFVAKEVILAAGAIHSPAMLMRSGIGPAAQLQSLGIAVLADRPGIGQNLMDHPMISISSYLNPSARLPKSQRRHIFLGMRWSSGLADCPPSDMYAVAYNRGAWHQIGWRIGGFLTWINKSYSRGSVRLQTSDVNAEPEVQFDLLGDERDLTRMIDSVRYLVGLFDHPAIREVAGSPFPTSYTERYKRLGAVTRQNALITTSVGRALDGPVHVRERLLREVITDGVRYTDILTDDAALGAYLRASTTGIWHASGTCRMGSPSDPHAVTDGAGKVIGVTGLRICDASIMPTIPCANPNVPIMMMAERISDLILERGGPLNFARMITAVDAHAEGEPGRVITGGVGPIPGTTVFEQMEFLRDHDDSLRRLMLREPRGYPGLCCNLVVPTKNPAADIGFIIMEQMEYAAMSGSNTICVVTVLLETGILPMVEPVTELTLEAPAGLVSVRAECCNGKVTKVSFTNVPAFAVHLDVPLEVPQVGTIKVDIAWGGMMFVLFDGWQVGLTLTPDEGASCVRYGEMVKAAAREQYPTVHPDHPEIVGPSIAMITGQPLGKDANGRNTVVISTGEFDWDDPTTWTGALDRSACGTGTCARMAVLNAKGKLGLNREFVHESILGTRFIGRLIEKTEVGPYRAVVPEISGQGWITGIAQYVLDPTDPFPEGYRVADIWGGIDG